MWTGNRCFSRVVCGAILAWALGSCAPGTAAHQPLASTSRAEAAWWYTLAVEPRNTHVRTIAVVEFNPEWVAATILGEAEVRRLVSPDAFAAYRDSDLTFAVTRDLDLDGTAEDIFVGTFGIRSGTRGRFLAVARDGRLVQHFEQPGSAGFSALLAVDEGVRWYKCLECGDYDLLRWTGGTYVLE